MYLKHISENDYSRSMKAYDVTLIILLYFILYPHSLWTFIFLVLSF